MLYLEGFLLHLVPLTSIAENYTTLLANITFIITAFSLLLLSREEGFLKSIFSNALGGQIARKSFPLVILIPLAVGYLRMQGQHLGLYDSEEGVTLIVVTVTFLISLQLFYNSYELNRIDYSRKKIKEDLINKSIELEKSEFLLKETGRLARVGGWEISLPDLKTVWTPEALSIRELDENGADFETAVSFYTPDSRETLKKHFNQSLIDGQPYELELKLLTAKGRKWKGCGCTGSNTGY
jgi:hypothetical protein